MKVIAIIPAYNEEERIEAAVLDAARFVDAVVVVDDGSHDATGRLARGAGAHVLTHALNRGQGAALQTGTSFVLQKLSPDVVIHFDADGQMRGEDIPTLVSPLASGRADVALGSRYLGGAENLPSSRRLLHKGVVGFTYVLSGLWLTDAHCGLRALTAPAAESLRITLDRMAHASELADQIAVKKLRYQEVPVYIRYTEATLAKGQKISDLFRVAYDFVKGKFLR